MPAPEDLPLWNRYFVKALAWCAAIPLLLLSGAFISLPAWFLSRGREPWHTLLLALGLAILVFGSGLAAPVPATHLGVIYLASLFALGVLRALFGAKVRNVENFAPVYMITAIAIMCSIQLSRLRALQARPRAGASSGPSASAWSQETSERAFRNPDR